MLQLMDYPYTIYKKKKFWHGDLKHQSSPLKKIIIKYNTSARILVITQEARSSPVDW